MTQLTIDFNPPTPPAPPLPTPWNVQVPVVIDDQPATARALFKLVDQAHSHVLNGDVWFRFLEIWEALLRRHEPAGEAAYMEAIKGLDRTALELCAKGFGLLVEHFWIDGCYADVLGPVYMEIRSNWGRSRLGQYFTPWSVCMAMAQMSAHDIDERLAAGEPISVCDPCVGSGAMLLAFRAAVADKHGRRAADRLRLHGQDLDQTCVMMATIQTKMSCGSWMSAYQIANAFDIFDTAAKAA